MNKKIIYLSGGISGLSYEQQTSWRRYLKEYIYDLGDEVECFDPTESFNEYKCIFNCEVEGMEYDLAVLRKSDLVVVNFNNPKSIGTAMELMLAKELKIPVIGIVEKHCELHPWLVECCLRIFDIDMYDNVNELWDSVIYYLDHEGRWLL